MIRWDDKKGNGSQRNLLIILACSKNIFPQTAPVSQKPKMSPTTTTCTHNSCRRDFAIFWCFNGTEVLIRIHQLQMQKSSRKHVQALCSHTIATSVGPEHTNCGLSLCCGLLSGHFGAQLLVGGQQGSSSFLLDFFGGKFSCQES